MKFPLLILIVAFAAVSCSKTIDNTGTCSDGIKNNGEQGIDCGGTCGNPCESCGDGIRNQGETAVDCGGPCTPCYERMTLSLNNAPWNATSRNAFISGPGTLRIYGTNAQQNITLYYSGNFAPGTVATGIKFKGEFRDINGTVYTSQPGGQISFTTFDTIAHQVSGTFQFLATDTISSATSVVSSGVFNVIPY